MLEIKELVKQYGTTYAVNRLDLYVEYGQIFGLVGPNGAGKTTLMQIMAGLLKATSGSIFIDGVDAIKSPRQLKETIGYMPQFFGVYDSLCVEEYMQFYASAYGLPYRSQKEWIDSVLDNVNLVEQKKVNVELLSFGLKQRLNLARTLLHDPTFLLLDDPTSGLDPQSRIEFISLVHDLQQQGKTIFMSSNELSMLADVCTDVGIINEGKIAVQGSVATLIASAKKKRIVQMTALAEPEKVISVLEEQTHIENVKEVSGFYEFEFLGEEEELALLLKTLFEAQLQMTYFKEKETTLQEVFTEAIGGVSS